MNENKQALKQTYFVNKNHKEDIYLNKLNYKPNTLKLYKNSKIN